MSHTMNMGCCNFIYDGGFDGNVTIIEKSLNPNKPKAEIVAPISEIEAFIAAKYRQELIGKLERASDRGILSSRWNTQGK